MKRINLILFLLFIFPLSYGQYSQYQPKDTSRTSYPYIFPFLGAKAYEKGFNLPLPAGVMANYFWAEQDIIIPDIAVGFSDGLLPDIPLTDITRIIEFEEIKASAVSYNVRPDLWVFPFLNVYGIFGKAYATTSVKLSYPIELEAVANLEGTSFGCGMTGAFGVGKYFVVLDGNWVWTNMSNFEEPVQSSVFSPRLGRSFQFKNRPQSNVAFWVGAMRVRMGNTTEGKITLRDVLPAETWQRRDELVSDYWAWYESVDPLKQQLADRIFSPIVDNIADSEGDGTIHYKLTKEPKKEWNVLIGGQYQINPHWQLRTEGGIIGNRKSFLASANYRFGF